MKISHKFATLLAAAALATSIPIIATAHEDHKKKSHGAQHGGQFVEFENHHGIEMVAGQTTLVFHITEDNKPMDLKDGSFKAIVQTNTETKMLPLSIDGNTLTTPIDAPLPKGAKIALSGKDRKGHAIQARFVKE